MEKPFPAYNGDEPYLFVCYAHEDAAVVYPELQWLRDQGMNVWYDEGIAGGANWRASIGGALDGASQVLFFVSEASVNSEHCDREINYALDENKHVVPVLLDDVRLPADLRVGLSRVQMIHRNELSDDAYRRSLSQALGQAPAATASAPASGRPSPIRWIGAAIAVAVLAVGVVGYLWIAEAPPAAEPTSAAPTKQSIAVLPFVNMSPDPNQEFFSDGISEELLNLLAKNPKLRVISRSSAFTFKGKDVDIPTIGERLGVAHVLEGSVRTSGNTVRITAQLIDTATDSHLWSETYDREMTDVFAIQDEIAQHVVEQLNVTLLGASPRGQSPVADTEAYRLYLYGRHLVNSFNRAAAPEAHTLLTRSVELDPNYAPAWAELGRSYFQLMTIGTMSRAEAMPLSRQAIERALALDPEYATAAAMIGWTALAYENDRATAARWLEQALAMEPGNTQVISLAIDLAKNLGRIGDAVVLAEDLVARDPLCQGCYIELAEAYLFAERYADAERTVQTQLKVHPGNVNANWVLGHTLMLQGNYRACYDAYRLTDPGPFRTYGEALCARGMGRQDEFETRFAALRDQYGAEFPSMVARIYGLTGDVDTAFDWLERNVVPESGPFIELYWEFLDIAWRPLQSDPRWREHLERIGATPEALAAIEFRVPVPQ